MCSLFVTERAHDEAMPAIFDRILPLNVVANTAIFYLAARLYFHGFGRSRFSFRFCFYTRRDI
jgi:hypothetical protein